MVAAGTVVVMVEVVAAGTVVVMVEVVAAARGASQGGTLRCQAG
jgi:hypothetical protein